MSLSERSKRFRELFTASLESLSEDRFKDSFSNCFSQVPVLNHLGNNANWVPVNLAASDGTAESDLAKLTKHPDGVPDSQPLTSNPVAAQTATVFFALFERY